MSNRELKPLWDKVWAQTRTGTDHEFDQKMLLKPRLSNALWLGHVDEIEVVITVAIDG